MLLKGYYKIDNKFTIYGMYELWEDKILGDTKAALITLDGVPVGKTFDSLTDWLHDNDII